MLVLVDGHFHAGLPVCANASVVIMTCVDLLKSGYLEILLDLFIMS